MKNTVNYLGITLFLLLSNLSAKAQYGEAKLTFRSNISTATISNWAGHIWISLESSSAETQNIGFYSSGLEDESARNHDIDYSFSIDAAAYSKVLTVIERYDNLKYTLGLRDCRSFARDVAAAAGLTVPDLKLKSPAEWLGDLVVAN